MIFLRRTRHIATILALLTATAAFVAVVARVGNCSADAHQAQSDDAHQNSSPSPPLASELISDQATAAEQRNAAQKPYEWPDAQILTLARRFWCGLLLIFWMNPSEAVLVVIGGTTAVAAFKTLMAIKDEIKETARAAKAAQDSADTTADILRLSAQTFLSIRGARSSIFESDERGNPRYVRVEWELFNSSNNPATITRLDTATSVTQGGIGMEKFPEMIAPQKGVWIPFDFGPLNAEKVTEYSRNKLLEWTKLAVTYKNPLGIQTTQTFEHRAVLGPKGFVQRFIGISMSMMDYDSTEQN